MPRLSCPRAYGDAASVAKAKEVGADDFMAKTYDFANLRRAIETLLKGKWLLFDD
jgi:hypothetical protein